MDPALSPAERRISVRRLSELPDFRANLARDVGQGLRDDPKWFPTKYLYDRQGAALFERLSRQPHYYLFSAETNILRHNARDVMKAVAPQEMVELGSGASIKMRLLLEAMYETTGCCRYVPLEISERALRTAAEELTAEYPWLQVDGYLGDFDTDLPKLARTGRRLFVFLGNTVGNSRTRPQRVEFLRKLSQVLVPGDALMLGFDLRKDVGEILAGYADPDGVQREFLMRSVAIMKSELGASVQEDHFDISIIWNPDISALEMRLVAQTDTELAIPDLKLEIKFRQGEYVLLAVSTKFTREMITQDLAEVGLSVSCWYTDSAQRYAVLVATPSTDTTCNSS